MHVLRLPITQAKVHQMRAHGMGATAIARCIWKIVGPRVRQ
jgi:hypothetical protein